MINDLLTIVAARWQTAKARRVATRELAAMSACELGDMGITLLDVARLFEPRLPPEFRSHGGAGRAEPKPACQPLVKRPAMLPSLESLA